MKYAINSDLFFKNVIREYKYIVPKPQICILLKVSRILTVAIK